MYKSISIVFESSSKSQAIWVKHGNKNCLLESKVKLNGLLIYGNSNFGEFILRSSNRWVLLHLNRFVCMFKSMFVCVWEITFTGITFKALISVFSSHLLLPYEKWHTIEIDWFVLIITNTRKKIEVITRYK